MSDDGALMCSDCGHRVYEGRVWDDFVICTRCDNLRILRHEVETPMRGHDPDGHCCRLARIQR